MELVFQAAIIDDFETPSHVRTEAHSFVHRKNAEFEKYHIFLRYVKA
jgi:hypothetical protein